MSTAQEAPALIQYACERCKTRFVLPPSRRRLGFGGRIKATTMALSRTLRFHEGLGSTYDGARRQMLAKMDDDAYQSFVQSFKFCHECRQFVCSECWSNSRRTCLGCFAKAAGTSVRPKPPFAPEGPAIPRPVAAGAPAGRRRRLRTDASLLVMGAAILLLVVELVFILPGTLNNRDNGAGDPGPTNTEFAVVPTDTPTSPPTDIVTPAPSLDPTASPTEVATPTPEPTATPTATPTPTPTATPTAVPTPAPTVRPTIRPTVKPTVKPTAAPKAFPTYVTLACKASTTSLACSWSPSDPRITKVVWALNYTDLVITNKSRSYTFSGLTSGTGYNVKVTVTFTNGKSYSGQALFYTT